MRLDDLVLVYDYYYWATKRILAAASRISQEQFVAPSQYHGDSLRDILVHTLSAERRWRSSWQRRERPPRMSSDEVPTIEALSARWREEEREMRDWLATLGDDDICRASPHPELNDRPLWQYMLHVANHGTQHRSEAAMLLTSYGQSPGDLDLVFFLLEQ